jgi:hypothetical protein
MLLAMRRASSIVISGDRFLSLTPARFDQSFLDAFFSDCHLATKVN